MGYTIQVDMEESRGLQLWFTAMKGLACDVSTYDGHIFAGQIDHTPIRRPDDKQPSVTYLLEVDEHGRIVDGGKTYRIEHDNVEKVSVW